MEHKKAEKWLEKRGIKLEESFCDALKNLARRFQKEHGIKNIEKVYSIMGLKKQYLAYWMKNPYSMQTKKLQKECNLCSCKII